MQINQIRAFGFPALTLILCSGAHAAMIIEDGSNNPLGRRNVFGIGKTEIIDPLVETMRVDLFDSGTLTPGRVIDFHFEGLPPGEDFLIAIDNVTGIGIPDATLGVFDEFGTLIAAADDGSPFGNGLGSAIRGVVNADGTIRATVSGFADLDFDGRVDITDLEHPESGEFDILVQIGTEELLTSDDFSSPSEFSPASTFSDEEPGGDFGPFPGLLGSAVPLFGANGSGGLNSYPQGGAVADPTGSSNGLVTGFGDFEFENASGFEEEAAPSSDEPASTGPIISNPEPSSIVLGAIAVLGAVCLNIKKRIQVLRS